MNKEDVKDSKLPAEPMRNVENSVRFDLVHQGPSTSSAFVEVSSPLVISDPIHDSSVVSVRERFAIFIKILFQLLDHPVNVSTFVSITTTTTSSIASNNSKVDNRHDDVRHHLPLRDVARQVVHECTHRHRERDPDYTPLMDVMTTKLRNVVGPVHWARAIHGLKLYESRSRRKSQLVVPRAKSKEKEREEEEEDDDDENSNKPSNISSV